jgi:AcrR family transcriptional regulator
MSSPSALPTPGRRGESRELTRKRLMQFGRRAFARKGLAGTNLKADILAPARVSVGSFYHQFADKTELFLEILREHSETFLRMIHEAHTPASLGDPQAIAGHSFATVFRIAEENDDLFRIMVREQTSEDPRVRAYLRENHRRWIESLAEDYRAIGLQSGSPVAEFDDDGLRLAAELISAMTLGTVLDYLDHPPRERPALRANRIAALTHFTLGGVIGLMSGASAPTADRSAAPVKAAKRKKGAR